MGAPPGNQRSFGHAGISGCLVWADPAADVAWGFFGTGTLLSGWTSRVGPRIGQAVLDLAAADPRGFANLPG